MRNPNETHAQTEARHLQEHYDNIRSVEHRKDEEIKALQDQLQQLRDENPNPGDWVLLEDCQHGPYLVVKLQYPKCKNHKGVKVLVFQATLSQVVKQKIIDPHFGAEDSTKIAGQPDKMIYPIARFAPTLLGWNDAVLFARMLANADKNKKE